jgi:nucleotide-binding universal stress UspA family protein
MIALTRVLVPTNLGEPSRAAVTYGVAFARQFGAQLVLLRVLTPDDYDAAIEAQRVVEALAPGAGEPDPDAVVRHAAAEALTPLLEPAEARDTRVEYVLRRGETRDTGADIAGCAREAGVQLIVMGKHRMGIVEHLLAGSVTEKVVRQAPCPVLIVQHPEHEFVLPDDPGSAGED